MYKKGYSLVVAFITMLFSFNALCQVSMEASTGLVVLGRGVLHQSRQVHFPAAQMQVTRKVGLAWAGRQSRPPTAT